MPVTMLACKAPGKSLLVLAINAAWNCTKKKALKITTIRALKPADLVVISLYMHAKLSQVLKNVMQIFYEEGF